MNKLKAQLNYLTETTDDNEIKDIINDELITGLLKISKTIKNPNLYKENTTNLIKLADLLETEKKTKKTQIQKEPYKHVTYDELQYLLSHAFNIEYIILDKYKIKEKHKMEYENKGKLKTYFKTGAAAFLKAEKLESKEKLEQLKKAKFFFLKSKDDLHLFYAGMMELLLLENDSAIINLNKAANHKEKLKYHRLFFKLVQLAYNLCEKDLKLLNLPDKLRIIPESKRRIR